MNQNYSFYVSLLWVLILRSTCFSIYDYNWETHIFSTVEYIIDVSGFLDPWFGASQKGHSHFVQILEGSTSLHLILHYCMKTSPFPNIKIQELSTMVFTDVQTIKPWILLQLFIIQQFTEVCWYRNIWIQLSTELGIQYIIVLYWSVIVRDMTCQLLHRFWKR